MDPKNRPDLEGNETAAAGAGGGMTGEGAATVMAAERGGEANLAPPTRQASDPETKDGPAPYASAGRAFTAWFNGMLTKVPNPTLKLGTKTARVESLHDDGRLEVYVQGEGGKDERQHVAFDSTHLDALLLKFVAASR